MADNSREVRDINFPEPPRREPELSPLRKEEPRRRRPSIWRNRTVWLALGLLLLAFAAFASFFSGRGTPEKEGSSYSFGRLGAELRKGASAYSELKSLSGLALDVAGLVDEMQKRVPDFISGRASLTDPLRSLKEKLEGIMSAFDRIAADGSLKDKVPFFSRYISWRGGLDRGREMLGATIDLLEKDSPVHLVVILGNTSELRPGGGFIGSFADIELEKGALKGITVRDINETDRTRDRLVIPPQPLQAITGKWRIADANWFFDYPASARKTIEFMRESEMYATTSIDVLAAITPRVVGDILDLTGPIRLSDGTEVNGGNFLSVIQNEVQEGQAAGAESPKLILAELAPVLRERLALMSSEDQGKLIEKIPAWIAAKDLMIFSPHDNLAKALAGFKADGALYPVAGDTDYLGIANANIGGGKTDIYMEQEARLESRIDDAGLVRNTLTLSRRHNGDEAKEWWYRETNWTYFKIFTPSGALPEDVKGFGLRGIRPKVDYKKGYSVDPDVASIEESAISSEDGRLQVMKESGRNVFGTWQKIAPGESKELQISYSRKMSKLPADGREYTFVFERQAGSDISFEAVFTAPLGYVWAENDLPIFEYKDAKHEGQAVLQLTFKKGS